MFHDSEGNAKRTMLIGTAVLMTLETRYQLLGIHNASFILALLLKFGHSMAQSCRLNESGWISKVLEKADEYNVAIEGTIPGIEKVLAEIRETGHVSKQSDEDESWLSKMIKDDLHCTLCYKSKPQSGGLVTLESFKAGTVREWKCSTWLLEVR